MQIASMYIIFTHFKLWDSLAKHNFKLVKIKIYNFSYLKYYKFVFDNYSALMLNLQNNTVVVSLSMKVNGFRKYRNDRIK